MGSMAATAIEPDATRSANCCKTVIDFGAKADGSADDTEAIQRAVNAGGDVQFPRGVYRITRPIVIDLDKTGPISISGSPILASSAAARRK